MPLSLAASHSPIFSPMEGAAPPPSTLQALSRPPIDARTIAQLRDYVMALNKRAVPIEKAALAAMELLHCGDKRALEQLLEGIPGKSAAPGFRSLPELVKESIDRGAPFRYVLGAPQGMLDLGGTFVQGWKALGRRMQLSPPPGGTPAQQLEYLGVLKSSLFNRSIDSLSPGQCLTLQLPGSSMVMAARDATGALLLMTNELGRAGRSSRLVVHEGRAAEDVLSAVMKMSREGLWALVMLDDAARPEATQRAN